MEATSNTYKIWLGQDKQQYSEAATNQVSFNPRRVVYDCVKAFDEISQGIPRPVRRPGQFLDERQYRFFFDLELVDAVGNKVIVDTSATVPSLSDSSKI